MILRAETFLCEFNVLSVTITFAHEGGRKNPFVVPLSYHHWSPWIGPHTRRSNLVLNTEFEVNKVPSGSEEDEPIDEERLTDELSNLKVNESMEYSKSTANKYTWAS